MKLSCVEMRFAVWQTTFQRMEKLEGLIRGLKPDTNLTVRGIAQLQQVPHTAFLDLFWTDTK